jgi:hypothetical protein
MKWPMPSEAKFSPEFQDVRPSFDWLHSFFQTPFPIRSKSVSDIPAKAEAVSRRHESSVTRILPPFAQDGPRWQACGDQS